MFARHSVLSIYVLAVFQIFRKLLKSLAVSCNCSIFGAEFNNAKDERYGTERSETHTVWSVRFR